MHGNTNVKKMGIIVTLPSSFGDNERPTGLITQITFATSCGS